VVSGELLRDIIQEHRAKVTCESAQPLSEMRYAYGYLLICFINSWMHLFTMLEKEVIMELSNAGSLLTRIDGYGSPVTKEIFMLKLGSL
jgi:hypothetical protein